MISNRATTFRLLPRQVFALIPAVLSRFKKIMLDFCFLAFAAISAAIYKLMELYNNQ